jgi:hypothetical protein
MTDPVRHGFAIRRAAHERSHSCGRKR